jgi:hypothetical protein
MVDNVLKKYLSGFLHIPHSFENSYFKNKVQYCSTGFASTGLVCWHSVWMFMVRNNLINPVWEQGL